MIKFRFKELLKEANLFSNKKITINQVSKSTGIARTSLNGLYNGNSKGVTFETLDRLVDFFNVPLDQLINYSKNKVHSIDIYKFKDTQDFKKNKDIFKDNEYLDTASIVDIAYGNRNIKIFYTIDVGKEAFDKVLILILWENNKTHVSFDINDENYKTLLAMFVLQNNDLHKYSNNQNFIIVFNDFETHKNLKTIDMSKSELVSRGNIGTTELHRKNSNEYIQINRH